MSRANALGGGSPKRKPFTFKTAPKPRGGTPALYDRIGPGGKPQTKPAQWQVRSRKAAIANSTGSRSAKHSDNVAREPMRKRNAAIIARYERLAFPQKQSALRSSLQKPDRELSRLLLGHVGGESKARQMLVSDDLGKGVLAGASKDALRGIYKVAKAGVDLNLNSKPLAASSGTVAGIPIASGNSGAPAKTVGVIGGTALGTAEALYRNPKKDGGSLRQRTVEDIATLPEAIIGGIAQLAYDTGKGVTEGHPLRGPAKAGGAMAADYAERYKPLVKGDYRKFEKGIEQRGTATPEILDLTTAAAVGGATVGRVGGALARAGKLGSKAERIATAPRPGLRVSGGVVKEQDVSKNLFRAAGQRLEDVRRTRQHERYAKKATEKGAGIEGLVPNSGEVVPLRSPVPGLGRLINNQRRLGNKEQGRVSSEATSRMDKAKNFVTRTTRNAQAKLSKPEKAAMPFATQGLLPLTEQGGYDIARSVKVLESYRKEIEAERVAAEAEAKRIEKEGGRPASASTVGLADNAIKRLRDRIDTIGAIDKILSDPEAHLTPNLAKQAQVVMDKLGPIEAGVNAGTAARRKARPQADIALKALRPSVAEVEKDLPFRLQPYQRDMTAREVADTLEPRQVPVEAFDEAASRKAVERRAGRNVRSATRPVSQGDAAGLRAEAEKLKASLSENQRPYADYRQRPDLQGKSLRWKVREEFNAAYGAVEGEKTVVKRLEKRREDLKALDTPSFTVALPKTVNAAMKSVDAAPVGSEMYHAASDMLVRKTEEGWLKVGGKDARAYTSDSIRNTFNPKTVGGGPEQWVLTTFGGKSSFSGFDKAIELRAKDPSMHGRAAKEERLAKARADKKALEETDAKAAVRIKEIEDQITSGRPVEKPVTQATSPAVNIGSGKSTRPETPAEMLRRAKEIRDTTKPTKEDVRPETPSERLLRAKRAQDKKYPLPRDRAEEIRAEIEALKSEKRSPERDERLTALTDDLIENEQKYYQQYADDVAKQAKELGLPINPAYFKHTGLVRETSGAYTTGPAIRYFDDLARSNMVLFKLGLYDMSPAAFEKGLMATVKRATLIRAISENVDTLAISRINDKAVPTNLNLRQLQHWMASEGLNIDGYYFFNPKKALHDDVLGSGDSPFFVDPSELVKGKTSRKVQGLGPDVQSMMQMAPDAVADSNGWRAIPLEAGGRALEKDAKGSSHLGRFYDRVIRGGGSALVLATSPAWLMMQRIVDAYGLTAASKFNPVKLARTVATYPFTWHSLTPQMQEAIQARIGAGYYRRAPKLGKTGRDIAGRSAASQWLISTWDDLSRSRVGRAGARVPGVLFDIDNWFTSHAKQMRYVSKAEEIAARQRYEALRESVGQAQASLDRVMAVVRKPAAKQIEDILQDSKVFDEAADHTHRAFGDWNNLSGAERHGLARIPMFYTWLRFAGRTLFHTLPVRHPVLLAFMLEIARAHKDAMDEYYRKDGTLLPGEELPGYAYSRIIREGGKVTDFGRISPVTALPLDMAQVAMSVLTGSEVGRGPKALLTSLPPTLTAPLEAILGESLLTGAKLKIGPDPKVNSPYAYGGLPSVINTSAARFLSSNPPYAALMMMLSGGKPVSDDSLPGAITELKYASEQGQGGAQAKLDAKGSPSQRALQRTFLPLAAMPDSMPAAIAVRRQKAGSGATKTITNAFGQKVTVKTGGSKPKVNAFGQPIKKKPRSQGKWIVNAFGERVQVP